MKCNECEEIATVLCTRFDEGEGIDVQFGYCNKHATEDAIFSSGATSCSKSGLITREQLQEVLLVVRASGTIPTELHLPSGEINPFFLPSAFAGKLTAEDIQRFIDKLSELDE